MLYFIMIFVFMAVIAVINIIFTAPILGFESWQIVLWTTISTVSVIAIDGFFAYVVRWKCPEKWFGIDKTNFIAGEKECRFYERIKIKKWKDKILELGATTGFRKNKISDPKNNEYVARYIMEANYGIGVHLSGMVFGFFATFACPIKLWLTIGLPVSVVNVFFNFLSFAILRYNLPKLHKLYRINQMRKEREDQIKENNL